MPRVLLSVVCAYWVAGFVVQATDAAGLVNGHRFPEFLSAAAVAAFACTAVAALFLWTLMASLLGDEDDLGDLAAHAASAALVTLAVIVPIAGGLRPGQLSAEVAVHLSALCATWLVARMSGSAGRTAERMDPSTVRARRLASEAAHRSMLTRLSRRGQHSGEDA